MLMHYLRIAARQLRRSPASAVVNVLTLALGLTCFVAASAVVGFWERAEQHFANADRTYVVTSVSWAGIIVPGTNAVVAELLEADFPAIEATARVTPLGREALRVSAEGRSSRALTYAADAEFLDIFDLPFVAGDPRDALREPSSVVLTGAAARSLYGSDNAVGKPVLIDGLYEATITGVIAEIPEPSHMGRSASAMLSFDMLASRDLYDAMAAATGPGGLGAGMLRGGSLWSTQNDITYILLPADRSLSAAQLREQLEPFVRRHAPVQLLSDDAPELELDLIPITELLATSASDAVFLREAGMSAPAVLLGLGMLVLLIACANYANLAIARAALRGREVGVRKTLGAKRAQLVLQYLVDAALHAFAALLIAVVVVGAIAPILDNMLGIDVGVSLLADLPAYALLAGLVVAVTALAGAYPAVVLSGVEPIGAIRGRVSPLGSRVLGHVLTGAQFAAASFLLVGVAVIFLQHRALEDAVLTESDDPLLIIRNDPTETQVAPDTLHDELLALPHVLAATMASNMPWSGGAGAPPPVGRTPDGPAPPRPVRLYGVGEGFFSTLEIPVLAGRAFRSGAGDAPTPGSVGPDHPLPIVVDRDLTERLGFSSPDEAAGEIVYWLWSELEPGGPANPLEIVGVVENRRLNIATGLGPASSIYAFSPAPLPIHLVRISGADVNGALDGIDALWARLAPSVPLERRFASDVFDERFESYARIARVFAMLTLFAFLISTFGLLGMALLLANRRVHEIAVRKTLGARKEQMVRMLMLALARPVMIANVAALPFAFFFARAYLGTFDQPIEMTPWPFVFGIVITFTVACLAVGQEAWRAASVRPSDALRRE